MNTLKENKKYIDILKQHMLNTDVIKTITSINNYKIKDNNIFNSNDKDKMLVKNNNKYTNWIPSEKDQLFWCFYYILHDEHGYELVHKNNFEYETKIKIKAIEKLRQKKDILKQHNIKLSNIEQEFSINEKTSIEGLYALCLLYNIRIILIKKYIYFDMGINDKVNGIIELDNNNNYSVKRDNKFFYQFDTSTINKIVDNKMKIMNANKMIKGVSSYTLDDIQKISVNLQIEIYNNVGKKRTKNDLYQEILSRLE